MKINLEDMVMGDIIRWRTQKDITFINVKDLVEAYWKDYFDDLRPAGIENFKCIG